jgi:hypothetical protein
VFPPSQNFIFTRKENKIIFLHEKFAIFLKIIANILNIAITLLKEACDINNHKLYDVSTITITINYSEICLRQGYGLI